MTVDFNNLPQKDKTAKPLNEEDIHNIGVFLNTLINSASFNPFDFETELLERAFRQLKQQ